MPNISNLVKKIDYITKISKTEKQISDHEHDKYLTTPEFDNLNEENFAARLEQVNLASKNNIAALYKKTDFANKLKNLNKNVTSNKKELNELLKKGLIIGLTKVVSTKGLIRDLINRFSTLFQSYLMFIPAKKYIK